MEGKKIGVTVEEEIPNTDFNNRWLEVGFDGVAGGGAEKLRSGSKSQFSLIIRQLVGNGKIVLHFSGKRIRGEGSASGNGSGTEGGGKGEGGLLPSYGFLLFPQAVIAIFVVIRKFSGIGICIKFQFSPTRPPLVARLTRI